MGIVLQSSGIYQYLTRARVGRALGGLLPAPARRRGGRSRSSGSSRAAEQRAGKLSGGQQRRLDLALALVGDPELVFLDEPTTGFDPAARRNAWGTIRSLRDLGKTVLLTTHYLDEAQALADRVAIIKDGRDPRRGPAVVARRRRGPLAGLLPRGRRRPRTRETDDPTTLLHELTGGGAGARRAARGPERHAARASKRSTSS